MGWRITNLLQGDAIQELRSKHIRSNIINQEADVTWYNLSDLMIIPIHRIGMVSLE